MIRDADWVVRVVMAGLVFASLVTWTAFLAKTFELGKARASKQVVRMRTAGCSFAEIKQRDRCEAGAD